MKVQTVVMVGTKHIQFVHIYPTAGNRSLLANDYTQINDLGYGLIATHGALSEQVINIQYTIVTSFMLTMVVRLDH